MAAARLVVRASLDDHSGMRFRIVVPGTKAFAGPRKPLAYNRAFYYQRHPERCMESAVFHATSARLGSCRGSFAMAFGAGSDHRTLADVAARELAFGALSGLGRFRGSAEFSHR